MHRFREPIHRPRGLATAALVAAIFGSCTPSPNASARPEVTAPPTVAATAAVSTAVSPTATAAPRPGATAPASDRYGLIVELRPPLLLRSEVDARSLAELSGELSSGAVSPDGRTFAYWETWSGAARVLRLLEATAPAQSRSLLTLPESEMAATSTGGGVAWSTDGKGLLIAVNSRDYVEQSVPDAAHLYATLRQVDIATGSVREIARKEPGHPFFPIAWDRPRGISAAVEWGPGGFATAYVTLRDGAAPVRTGLPAVTLPIAVRAAPDASRVLMWSFFAEDSRAVYVWPLAEPAQRITLEAVGDERVVAAIWRDAREIVVSLSPNASTRDADRLEVWPLEGPRRVVLRGQHRLDAVRPDGTAAITSRGVVDLATGATAPIPGLGSGQRVLASLLIR